MYIYIYIYITYIQSLYWLCSVCQTISSALYDLNHVWRFSEKEFYMKLMSWYLLVFMLLWGHTYATFVEMVIREVVISRAWVNLSSQGYQSDMQLRKTQLQTHNFVDN